MKRITVLFVLILTLATAAMLTSCGCEASNQAGQNDQTTNTTPDNGTNGGSTNHGGSSDNHGGSTGSGGSSANNGGSMAGDIMDGGEDIMNGVVEGGEDVLDGVGDALDGKDNVQGGVTYDDMVRNGRARDADGFINKR